MAIPPGVPSAAAPASTTPAISPRQPACTPITVHASALQPTIGTQSAPCTSSATPGAEVTMPSAAAWPSSDPTNVPPPPSGPTATTVAPCTWVRVAARSPSNPPACASARRLARTCRGSSPHALPRLRLAWRPVLSPPVRVVKAARTRGGHPGTSSSAIALTSRRRLRRGRSPSGNPGQRPGHQEARPEAPRVHARSRGRAVSRRPRGLIRSRLGWRRATSPTNH